MAATQCMWASRCGEDDFLKFKPSIRMGKKGDLSDFERGMVVCARQAGLSIWIWIWLKVHESMDPSCLVSTVQAGGVGGVMVWGIFSWHTLGPLVPIEHRLYSTAYLSIVADHVHPIITTVYPSSDGYFQQDNAPCHKAQIISDRFLEHDNEFTLIKRPPQSLDLNPIEHLWDVVDREIHIMDVQPTNLQQLRDAIMSIWTKIHNGMFQGIENPRNVSNTLLNLCHKQLRKFWRQKGSNPVLARCT